MFTAGHIESQSNVQDPSAVDSWNPMATTTLGNLPPPPPGAMVLSEQGGPYPQPPRRRIHDNSLPEVDVEDRRHFAGYPDITSDMFMAPAHTTQRTPARPRRRALDLEDFRTRFRTWEKNGPARDQPGAEGHCNCYACQQYFRTSGGPRPTTRGQALAIHMSLQAIKTSAL